ncbi:ATP11 protein-domain-containing protein [Cokeromyces recurvatus]|uniref:ATP11 protein-domain-containing protein n=1 Tax=Cokeromyces recurvatus TaxID=90255 RepID=UPI00221F4A2E|nr:ATP11 protein-domain-containing protein [Cokeromyces recurvatus]KAI7902833.1 ATP11 protein-domain-containing protein [Cokeromyces recurvatus]
MISTTLRQFIKSRSLQRNILASKPLVHFEKGIIQPRLGQNRFYNTEVRPINFEAKYADKIKEIAKREGLTVEELKKKMKDEAAKKLKASQPIKKTIVNETTKKASADTIASKSKLPYESSAPTLDKLVKLDLLEKETPENIEKIWNAGHANKDCITAVIPSDVYDKLYKRSQQYPMFVLPMPREEGVEFFFLQFNFHQCNFTSLLEYKTKGTEARPFLTLTHFPELQKSKGIVLMKGEINKDPRMLDTANAQFLAFALQQFYVTGGEEKLKLVEKFHKQPAEFDFQDLIKAVETLV